MHPKGYNYISMSTSIAAFVKERRHMFGLTQVDLAEKSGVGLRFVRELEQGSVGSVRTRSGSTADKQQRRTVNANIICYEER